MSENDKFQSRTTIDRWRRAVVTKLKDVDEKSKENKLKAVTMAPRQTNSNITKVHAFVKNILKGWL